MTRDRRRQRPPGRAASVAMLGALFACIPPPAVADDGVAVDGYGRIEGRYCPLSARLVLDDGRRFEADAALAQAATVEIRSAVVAPALCGNAPRLTGGIVVVPARPAIELTMQARDWSSHAAELDALMRRFAQARLRLRVLGADRVEADTAVLRIATVLLQQRPDVMARTTIVTLSSTDTDDAQRGWRVAPDAFEPSRSLHADSAADVARLLAAAR